MADVVALDMVRLIDGRTAAQIEAGYGGQPTLDNAVAAASPATTTTCSGTSRP